MNRAERRRQQAEARKDDRTVHAEDVPSHLLPWTPFVPGTLPANPEAHVRSVAAHFNLDDAAIKRQIARLTREEIWLNSRYQVNIDRSPEVGEGWPPMIHLSIKRRDKEPVRDWRDLQRIKNELIGPEHEAVELYPAEARLIDLANQFHLWVLADKDARFPFGWNERLVVSESLGNGKQRPRDDDA